MDHILAVVNGESLLLSDVEIARTFQLVPVATPMETTEPGADSRKAIDEVLRHLVDQKILRTEAQKFNITVEGLTDAEVSEEIQRIKSTFQAGDYDRALHRWALSEEALIQRIREKVAVDKYLSFRIRFFAVVSPDSVQKYYQDHASDYSDRQLESVRTEIEGILMEQESRRMVASYLERLKGQTKIRINPY